MLPSVEIRNHCIDKKSAKRTQQMTPRLCGEATWVGRTLHHTARNKLCIADCDRSLSLQSRCDIGNLEQASTYRCMTYSARRYKINTPTFSPETSDLDSDGS